MKKESLVVDAAFDKEDEEPIEFYITSMQKLYTRQLDHAIEKPHKIGFNAMFIVTKGKGVHTVDFTPYSYTKGTVFFIAKEQIHNFKINPYSDGYLIAFTDNFLSSLTCHENSNIFYEIFDYIYYPAKLELKSEIYEDLLKLIKILQKEFAIKIDEHKELMLRSLLQAIILKLARERLSQKVPLASRDRALYGAFKKLSLNHNYALHVNDYARLLGVSSKTLTNMLNKYLDKSTKKYLDENLILQIKRLLLDESLSLEKIANKLSFDETTNMVKFFKRYEGVTPTQFAKKQTS